MDYKAILLVAIYGAAINWYASRKGFFKAPSMKMEYPVRISLITLIGVFAIYFGVSFLIQAIVHKFFSAAFNAAPIIMMNWVQILIMSISLVLLFIFARATVEKQSLYNLWKDKSYPHASSISYDLGLGPVCWLLAFPIVMVVGELSDLFINLVFGPQNYEQVAVMYLRMTSKYPSLLVIALMTVLIAAPCIEEFLFRGVLQNWIRQYLGPKSAILLSSLGFAFFHMAPSQGFGNISLVLSLFVFACFLGFVYEKQRSLYASISLHIVFNAVSTFRILFVTE